MEQLQDISQADARIWPQILIMEDEKADNPYPGL